MADKEVIVFLKKWLVPDNLPDKADAICCLSYGLSWNKTRLTEQGLCCVLRAFELYKLMIYKRRYAPIVILSNAYDEYWKKESELKNYLAIETMVPIGIIFHLVAVHHTYDEASQIKNILKQINAESLILVADRWHMKRALDAFRVLMPEIKIYPASVKPTYYEMAREPSLIKSIRSRFETLWIAWNILFFYLNPLFLKNRP